MQFLLIIPKFVPFKLQQLSFFVLYHLSFVFVPMCHLRIISFCILSVSFLFCIKSVSFFVLSWYRTPLTFTSALQKTNIINNGGLTKCSSSVTGSRIKRGGGRGGRQTDGKKSVMLFSRKMFFQKVTAASCLVFCGLYCKILKYEVLLPSNK